jgi:hypothetical protein
MEQPTLILDPSAPAAPPEVTSARAPLELRGRTVAFIDNTKPNFDRLADAMAEALIGQHGVANVIRHRKRAPSDGASPAFLDDLVGRCDLVIAGSGD